MNHRKQPSRHLRECYRRKSIRTQRVELRIYKVLIIYAALLSTISFVYVAIDAFGK